jgi:hypothetical protein
MFGNIYSPPDLLHDSDKLTVFLGKYPTKSPSWWWTSMKGSIHMKSRAIHVHWYQQGTETFLSNDRYCRA